MDSIVVTCIYDWGKAMSLLYESSAQVASAPVFHHRYYSKCPSLSDATYFFVPTWNSCCENKNFIKPASVSLLNRAFFISILCS